MNTHTKDKIKAIILEFCKQERAETGCRYGQPDGYEDYVTDCDCDLDALQQQIILYGITHDEIIDLVKEAHEQS